MDVVLKHRGRVIREADLAVVRTVIAENPMASRRELSRRVCGIWNWVQANGAPRDMVCRGLMLALDRAGHIALPPVKSRPPNPLAARPRPQEVEVDSTPVECGLKELGPLEFRLVRRTPEEAVFNGLIERHHYLGYTQPVGEQLKYMVFAGERPVACLAWSSAARHLGPRDRFIGWSPEARRRNIRFLAYNSRCVGRDWERQYGHPVYYLETFIDVELRKGTCYLAANWTPLGLTTGRGKADSTNRPNRSLKQVLGYPLNRRFRHLLETL